MSDTITNYVASLNVLERAIRGTDPAAWDNPSPCELWTARCVAGHAMTFIRNVVALAGDGPDPDFHALVDFAAVAGPDPNIAWTATRSLIEQQVLTDPARLDKVVMTPLGSEMRVEDFLSFQGMDPVVHGWDIATASGNELEIDPGLAAGYQARFEPLQEAIREAGLLGPHVELDDDAGPVARLLSFCGRDPR